MPSMREKVQTQKKSVSPSHTQCVSAFMCTVNIHVEDVKAHPQRSGSAPEGCCIFIPSLPTDTSPHCYKLYTHPKVLRNPFHCSVSLCQLPKTENRKRGHNARYENADRVISHWRGGGVCGVKRSSRSTFDLARFSKNTDHVDNTCYENTDHVIIHQS